MRASKLTFVLVLAVMAAVRIAAQNPEADLQRAIQREEAVGDLKAAAAEYGRIAEVSAASNPEVAVRSLLRQARVAEKQGDVAEGRRIYERIRREFPTQAATLALNQSTAPLPARPRTRTLGEGADTSGTVSRDGRFLSFSGGGGNLGIFDLRTQTIRALTERPDYSLHLSAVSPDGGLIAYGTFNGCEPGQQPRLALCLVSTDGTGMPTPRVLYASDDVSEIRPMDWSHDGKLLAVSLRRADRTTQVGFVSIADRQLHVVETVDWRGPTRVFFSPDGRDLAFDLPTSDLHDRRDIYVRGVESGRGGAKVVEAPGQDVVMGWSSDGELLFASDRTSTMALWSVKMVSGRPVGSPRLIEPGIATAWSLGLTTSGSLYLGVRASERDVSLVDVDLNGGTTRSAPSRVVEEHVGTTLMPEWSPDGRRLAFVSGRGFNPTNNEGRIIAIRTLATGEIQELYPQLLYFGPISWSPDGRTLLTSGTDLKGRDGIYAVDVETAAVRHLVDGHIVALPRWAPDGQRFFYRRPVEGAGGDWEIVERYVDTGADRVLADGAFGAFSVSPDGKSLAVTRGPIRSGVATSIALIDAERAEVRDLLQADADQGFMTVTGLPWVPDGSGVLVRTQRPRELWLVSVSGAAPRRLDIDVSGWQTGTAGQFQLSPDGRQIAFTSGAIRDELRVLENVLP